MKMFPCPYCRFELSGRSIGAVPSLIGETGVIAVDSIWDRKLEYYSSEESKNSEGKTVELLSDVGGLVLAGQSQPLREYVRKIQDYQRSLKQRLHCEHVEVCGSVAKEGAPESAEEDSVSSAVAQKEKEAAGNIPKRKHGHNDKARTKGSGSRKEKK
jgi:hypothetical protein